MEILTVFYISSRPFQTISRPSTIEVMINLKRKTSSELT